MNYENQAYTEKAAAQPEFAVFISRANQNNNEITSLLKELSEQFNRVNGVSNRINPNTFWKNKPNDTMAAKGSPIPDRDETYIVGQFDKITCDQVAIANFISGLISEIVQTAQHLEQHI